MSFFEDKEYENLDWLNAAIEAYTFSLNEKISQLDELTELPLSMLGNNIQYGLEINTAIKSLFQAKDIEVSSRDIRCASLLFEFEAEQSTIVNFTTCEMSSPIFIRRKEAMFDDVKLPEVVYSYVYDELSCISKERADISRYNEVMDLINCTDYRNSKSANRKFTGLATRVKEIMNEDLWKIRNMDLFVDAARWMRRYIEDGNLGAITNLTKLKCMTHSKNPIYSMKEII